MGSGLTHTHHCLTHRQEIIDIMMPVYYLSSSHVTHDDILIAKTSWSLITDDKSQEFIKQKSSSSSRQGQGQGSGQGQGQGPGQGPGQGEGEEFHYHSCIGWFYILYYERLFDIHPLCKPLFTTGIISQGKFLVKMISLTLNQLHDPMNFQIIMRGLALSHCHKGVRSVEYGIVGSVLFYTLKKVLNEEYSEVVHRAWVKIYSAMLSVIVPMVVDYELQEKNMGQEGMGGGEGGGGGLTRINEGVEGGRRGGGGGGGGEEEKSH
jgi:hemoglobin-like flavoprotein